MTSEHGKITLINYYNHFMHSVRIGLSDHYPPKYVWKLIEDGRQALMTLKPNLPDIGQGNIWQSNLEISAMILAISKILKKDGYSLLDTVEFIQKAVDTYLKRYPVLLRKAFALYHFSPYHIHRLRTAATRSQLRRCPGDWVFTFVQGDGICFNFGVDIHECAIMKFYRAQRVEELTPYLCRLDHLMGERMGLGFDRQGTLANGAAVCDCRWKYGAETRRWSPIGDLARQDQSIKWRSTL